MNAIPKFEPLEDRIVLDGEATVSIDGPGSIFIGDDDVAFTLTFDNTDPTETGYVPFIDFVLPTNGTDGYDGIGPLNPDDITFLGAEVPFTEIVFDGSGNAEHPLAVDTNGDPIIISGTPGDTLVVIELPYGSFSAGNPAVDIDVSLDFSDLADLSNPFNLSATGGFAFGCDPLDNPADDPSTFGATDTFVVTQQLFEIEKTNNIPEAEAATGPSYIYQHTITVDVADNQTLSNFTLVDNLPPEMVYVGNLSASGGTVITEPTPGPAGTGNNLIEIDYATISGTTTVTFDFYIADVAAGETAPIINEATGDQVDVTNTVTGTGDWDPLDPNDPTITVSDSDDDVYQATSLAIQKTGVISSDIGVAGPTPGDVYDFTLNVQVSDYFTYGDLLISDTLGNGFGFVDGSAALVAIVDDTGDTYTLPVDLTAFETQTAGTGANAGETTNVWDISAALIAAGDADGLLTGDDVDGVFDGSNTTIQVVYQATVLDQYADNGNVTDVELSQGDFLSNDTRISGSVRDNDTPTTTIGTEENESATEVQLPFGAIREKTVYAINGVVPSGDVVISAGDEVTWRVVYDAPLGSFEMLRIADNLPQNVFVASEVTTFITNPTDPAVAPPAGSAQYGAGDEFSALGGGDPTITIDAPNNGVNFGFNNLSVDPRAPVAIEILFTVTVEDAIFADDLLLTNQATAFESNTFSGEVDTTAIAQFVYAEPVLGITKGIVATDSPDPATAFTDTPAPTAFTDPGLGNPRFAGTISSDDLATDPIDADLDNIDAGDLVTFAIVVENTGTGPNGAFNVTIEDTLPPGFEIPGGSPGLNLSVTDGTGARAIGFTGDLFTSGIVLDDRGLEGSLSAYDPDAGDNLVIITYDLLASDSVTSNDVITNTATLSNYNAFEGSPGNVPIDRTPVDLTDDAVATVADVEITKTLQGREFGEGGPNEVLIGEEFTFTVRMDIQEGTYANAVISDSVSTGGGFGDYEILSAEITDWNAALSASTGVTLGSAGDVAADGNSVSFDLGTLINAGTNTIANDFFEFEVTARSLGSDPVSGGDDLGNDANFSADGVDVTETESVDLTEPTLTIGKTADPAITRPNGAAGAGETINYALNIANVAGASDAPAYDLVITDVLDPNVTLDVGSVTVLLDGADVSLAAVTTGNSGGDTTIQINIDVLDEGLPLVVTYSATVIPDVEAAVIIDNTADLTFDTLETDDADDERDYALDADAEVPVVAPEIDKTIIATSNPDTVGGDLAIGETVTYQIVIDIPEGASTNAVLQDVLPTTPGTLTYVDSEVVRIGFASGAGDITGSNLAVGDAGVNVGATTTFDFGDLLNANNLTINAGDQIVVNVTAILSDLPANQSGDTLVNTATFSTDSVSASDTATVDVVEPVLNIDKVGTPAEVDAGDTVTYTVVSENTGNAPAYDIIIDDDLADTGLTADTSVAATIVILDGGGADVTPVGLDAPSVIYPTAGGGLQASIPILLPGQTIEIVYQSIVTDLAEFDGSVDNTAEVTRFDSDPAGDGTDPDDGRVYDDGLTGYTVPSDDVSIDTPVPTFSKTIVATDNADTLGTDVAISEIITYELEITIPEGTSTLVLTDDLPAGLVPVSAEVTTYDVAAISSNLTLNDTDASAFITVGPDGGYVFDFGTLTNAGDNIAANNTIILTVQAQVDDIAAVTDGANLENTATLALVDPVTGDPLIDPDTGLPQTYSDTADVDVVEPALDIDKTVVPLTADAGDTVTYTVVSTNTGTAPAYDIIIDDTLSDPAIAASAPAVASIVITDAGGGVVTPAEAPSITYPTAGGGLQASIPALQPGETITIVFEAVVTDLAEFSGDVDNTAEVTRFDTDPEGDGTDPDDGRVYDEDLTGYTVPSDDAEVLTPDVALAKDYTSSSDALTDDVAQNVGIGEVITYTLTISVPEGSGDLLLTDVLPAGLEALSASVVSLGTGGNTTTDNLSVGDTDASGFITIAAGGGSVIYDFGTAIVTGTDDAAATGADLVVEVVSRVRDLGANVDTTVLTNTATLQVTDPVTGLPLQPDPVATETVTVVEPNLTIEKIGPIAANPGDVLPYQLVIENTGTGPAHDILIQDPMITTELSLLGTPTFTVTPSGIVLTPTVNPLGDGFSAIIPSLDVGETLTVDFQVQISAAAEDAESFFNTATIDYDTVPDGLPASPTGRTYENEDDHSVGTVPFLVKTATDSELSETGADQYDLDNIDLVVGEEVTYTFDLYLPEILMDSVVMVDTLPAGLQFVSANFVSAGLDLTEGGTATALSATSVTITNTGQITEFDFGAVNNPNDGVIGDDDVITVQIVALVLDDPAVTSDGDTLTNTATLDVSAGGTDLNQATATEVVDVVDPELTIDKTGPLAAEPGDTVTYNVTIENTGTGPAYDTVVTDLMDDPNIDFNAGTVTFTPALTPSNPVVVASGDGFTFTVPLLLPGEEVIFTYTADIALTAPATIGYDNTVSADYSSSPDGDGRDKTGSDDHAIGGSPTLEKAILSTNIDATGDDQFGAGTPDVVIGEEITYALTITLPEIPMDSVIIQDTLPDGLEFVTASLDVANTGVPGAAPTIVNSGQITTFDFGVLTNPADGSIGADDEIVVLITARVTADILNVDGLPLTNNATLNVTPEGETPFSEVTDASTVEIVEPEIVVDKVGPIAVDQGDTVPYTVTITNTGTGPAADLLFSDPMDPGGFLSFDVGSVTAELTPAAGVPVDITTGLTIVPDGNGFTVLFDELLAGAEITLTYTATLDADAPQAQSFVNTATVDYDTVPDGDPETPTGRPDTDSDDHSVATNPSLTKDATASSFSDTGSDQGDGDLLDLNIGEEVTYTLQLTLPEIEMDSVVLQDTLPAGLTFVSAQVLDLAGVTPAGVIDISNSGQITTFDFGAVSNPSDGSLGADDIITVEIVAIVDNVPANLAITPLTNTATLNITPQGEPPLEERSAEETVEVVEPELELEKVGPLAVNPGDTVPYEITVTNTGSGAAYDVVIADAVANANLDFTAGTVVVTLDGVTQTVTVDESGTGFSVEVPVIQAGQTLVVTYDAVLSPDAAPANSFANDATVVFDNIPGDPADPTLNRPGTDTDDHLVATIPTLDKNVIATSNPDTGDDVHEDGIQDLAIGEEVTYELVLTLPEIDMGSVILTDALPTGLTFVSFEVTGVGAGIITGDPTLTQTGQLLSFDFGNVVNPFDGSIGADDQITVQVTTLVANVPSNADGVQLTNTGSLTVTPQGGTPLDTQTDTATIDIVEPELVIDKSVNDITPTIGDTITYTLVLTNEGTSPAYNVVIDDPLPFQLLLTGNVVLSDPSLGTVTAGNTDGETLLVIDIPRLMPGETITVDYDVFIGFQSDVLSGLVNVADVTGSSTPEGGGVISGRPDTTGGDAIIVADPVPTDEGERKRIPNLGIDDAQFLPVLSIDPIYSGTAEPGSNVTVSLYRDNGALSYSRHIMADAGGHWIAIFPRVEHEQVAEDFWDFYAGSNVFDAPVQMIDDADLTGLAFADDTRNLVVGADIAEESYDLQLRTDRSSMLPQDHPMHNARTFYANAVHQMPFLRADTLNVGEVFENIAADTVSRLYEASTNPLGDGLNRFNYEFLSEATASPGSAR